MMEGAEIAFQYSGVPPLTGLDTASAAARGEAMLRYVHGLGGALNKWTVRVAARWGQVGALRYAVQNGAPWDRSTLVAAVEGDSLDCLRYTHEAGCPLHLPSRAPFRAAAWSLRTHGSHVGCVGPGSDSGGAGRAHQEAGCPLQL